jgi:Zn-dependent membrane protease YugP
MLAYVWFSIYIGMGIPFISPIVLFSLFTYSIEFSSKDEKNEYIYALRNTANGKMRHIVD